MSTSNPSSSTNQISVSSLAAITALIIGISVIPTMALCWFMGLGLGLGARPENVDTYSVIGSVAFLTPVILSLLGVIAGVIGLRSPRRWLALVGMLMSGGILILSGGLILLFFIATSLAS